MDPVATETEDSTFSVLSRRFYIKADSVREGFRKVDLHIHTPESSCYIDRVMPEANLITSAQDIVKAALAAGLEGIAVTDHNSVGGLEAMREAASRSGLWVLPGVELSAKGGHILALFERDTPTQRLHRLLQSLGFGEEGRGLGYWETPLWIDEVFRQIGEAGGVAIAAHIDRRPKGFIASEEPLAAKMRIHSSDHLEALEITVPRDRSRWRQGQMPHYPKRYPCIQGSDAHAPDEVGRRPFYIKVPELTLAYLRLAFQEYEARIRFPDDFDLEKP